MTVYCENTTEGQNPAFIIDQAFAYIMSLNWYQRDVWNYFSHNSIGYLFLYTWVFAFESYKSTLCVQRSCEWILGSYGKRNLIKEDNNCHCSYLLKCAFERGGGEYHVTAQHVVSDWTVQEHNWSKQYEYSTNCIQAVWYAPRTIQVWDRWHRNDVRESTIHLSIISDVCCRIPQHSGEANGHLFVLLESTDDETNQFPLFPWGKCISAWKSVQICPPRSVWNVQQTEIICLNTQLIESELQLRFATPMFTQSRIDWSEQGSWWYSQIQTNTKCSQPNEMRRCIKLLRVCRCYFYRELFLCKNLDNFIRYMHEEHWIGRHNAETRCFFIDLILFTTCRDYHT